MSIYKRGEIGPEWEPVPWAMGRKAADDQERGFHQRAIKPIRWARIQWDAIPNEGIFGHQKNWLVETDVRCFATMDEEDLLLIDNIWFGWPDPPRWGLVSRPSQQTEANWTHWGYFPDLPGAWQLPEGVRD